MTPPRQMRRGEDTLAERVVIVFFEVEPKPVTGSPERYKLLHYQDGILPRSDNITPTSLALSTIFTYNIN
jgi:hypothetical protein